MERRNERFSFSKRNLGYISLCVDRPVKISTITVISSVSFARFIGSLMMIQYCRFGNVRENLFFANIREFGASRIQSSC